MLTSQKLWFPVCMQTDTAEFSENLIKISKITSFFFSDLKIGLCVDEMPNPIEKATFCKNTLVRRAPGLRQ